MATKATPSTRKTTETPAAAVPGSNTQPGPEHWRYMEAVAGLLESDEDFTTKALAKRLGMTPIGLHKFRYERPDVTRWASDQLEAKSRAMVGPLLLRCAELAQAGSAGHAQVLIQYVGNAIASQVATSG
jgi:hypothetical protein